MQNPYRLSLYHGISAVLAAFTAVWKEESHVYKTLCHDPSILSQVIGLDDHLSLKKTLYKGTVGFRVNAIPTSSPCLIFLNSTLFIHCIWLNLMIKPNLICRNTENIRFKWKLLIRPYRHTGAAGTTEMRNRLLASAIGYRKPCDFL